MPYMVVGLRNATSQGETAWLADPNLTGSPGIEAALSHYLTAAEEKGWKLAGTTQNDGDSLLILHSKPEKAKSKVGIIA